MGRNKEVILSGSQLAYSAGPVVGNPMFPGYDEDSAPGHTPAIQKAARSKRCIAVYVFTIVALLAALSLGVFFFILNDDTEEQPNNNNETFLPTRAPTTLSPTSSTLSPSSAPTTVFQTPTPTGDNIIERGRCNETRGNVCFAGIQIEPSFDCFDISEQFQTALFCLDEACEQFDQICDEIKDSIFAPNFPECSSVINNLLCSPDSTRVPTASFTPAPTVGSEYELLPCVNETETQICLDIFDEEIELALNNSDVTDFEEVVCEALQNALFCIDQVCDDSDELCAIVQDNSIPSCRLLCSPDNTFAPTSPTSEVTLAPTLDDYYTDPSPFVVVISEENEIKNNPSDYVGVIFTDDNLSEESKAPFMKAAAKWSAVIAENLLDQETEQPTDQEIDLTGFLPLIIQLPAGLKLNHLYIIAHVVEIDGPGGILAQAGPLLAQTEPDGKVFPTVGLMSFDLGDFDQLELEGNLDDVVLHEMGHVLGIGTLWTFVDPPLILNPVFDDNGGVTNDPISPTFNGESGNNEFAVLGGSGGIPIEDGRDASGNLIFNPIETGQGSIDGHWKKTVFGDEIMTFSLGAGSVHPLSLMTIKSLEDLGYVVNASEAEAFSLPSASTGNLRGDIENIFSSVKTNEEKKTDLTHDALAIKPKLYPRGTPWQASKKTVDLEWFNALRQKLKVEP